VFVHDAPDVIAAEQFPTPAAFSGKADASQGARNRAMSKETKCYNCEREREREREEEWLRGIMTQVYMIIVGGF
jgi:hypothetical protein